MTNTEFTPYTIEGLDEYAGRNGWAKISQQGIRIQYVTPTGNVLRFYSKSDDTILEVENVEVKDVEVKEEVR
jgi:predicted heme/steroid binding protein